MDTFISLPLVQASHQNLENHGYQEHPKKSHRYGMIILFFTHLIENKVLDLGLGVSVYFLTNSLLQYFKLAFFTTWSDKNVSASFLHAEQLLLCEQPH